MSKIVITYHSVGKYDGMPGMALNESLLGYGYVLEDLGSYTCNLMELRGKSIETMLKHRENCILSVYSKNIHDDFRDCLHVLCGDYIFRCDVAVIHWSDTEINKYITYKPSKVYYHNNSDYVKLVKSIDAGGIDDKLLEDILSKCTEAV